MLRLIQPDFAATGKAQLDDRAPALFMYRGAFHIFLGQRRDFGWQVVTEEIQLVRAVLSSGVKSSFGGRQCEDEPTMAGVDRRKPQNIAEKARSASAFLL
ncbi:MAG TPA: hypothetical protein VGD60_07965 [Candidatus Acidoferrales bacterium]